MGLSVGLAAYLEFSRRAMGLATRKLEVREKEGKEDGQRINERMGQPSKRRPDGPMVWFHAASVGESLSILELVKRLGVLREDLNFLITTGTVTSARIMANRLPDRALHQYAPVDALVAVRGFLDHWQPDLAIWTESELWPALIYDTARRRIPMLLINARMSTVSHNGWRWMPGVSRSLLRRFDYVLAQEDQTAGYLKRLGLPSKRIEVTGTLKEGSAALPHDEAERASLALQLAGRPVWLAASTHEGEEEIVARAHQTAARSTQRLLLVIAPRHPERGPQIAKTLVEQGWKVGVRSRGDRPEHDTEIYVADTLGEMGIWFRIAPVSFLGGSLLNIGGHNPFEPAALGSAIIHGPFVQNFADIFKRLSEAGATVEVKSAPTLAKAIGQVMSPDRAAAMAHSAWEVCSSGAEVTDRALDVLMERLPAEKGAE